MDIFGIAFSKVRGAAGLFHRDEDGQIVFIGVFGAVSFALALGMMMNLAVNIQAKVRSQNRADAAILASAEVMASGLNLVSDNNVAIAELAAIKSISEGLAKAAGDAKLVINYYGVTVAATAATYIPYIGYLFRIVKFLYGGAWNYADLICEYEDKFEEDGTLPGMMSAQVTGLQAFNTGVKIGYPIWAMVAGTAIGETRNEAAMTRIGNNLLPVMLYPLKNSEDSPVEYWNLPIRQGSRSDIPTGSGDDSSPNADFNEGRFGFTHVYLDEAQGDNDEYYALDEAPYPKFMDMAKPLWWYMPYLDPFAILKMAWDFFWDAIEGFFSSIFGGSGWDAPSEDEVIGDLIDDSPLEDVVTQFGGIFDKWGNETFERHANNFLVAYIENDMAAPVLLEDYQDALSQLGPVGVSYGGAPEPRWYAGRGTINPPFARRLGGFESPIDSSGNDTRYGVVAIAQAQVYNPISWDLFTQYWDYKLTRVNKIPDVWSPLAADDTLKWFMPVLNIEEIIGDSAGLGSIGDAVKGPAQRLGDFIGLPFEFSPSFELYH